MKATHLALLLVGAFAIASCSSFESADQQPAMEKQACAEAGLTPGTQAFSDCFANMAASIDRSESVMGR